MTLIQQASRSRRFEWWCLMNLVCSPSQLQNEPMSMVHELQQFTTVSTISYRCLVQHPAPPLRKESRAFHRSIRPLVAYHSQPRPRETYQTITKHHGNRPIRTNTAPLPSRLSLARARFHPHRSHLRSLLSIHLLGIDARSQRTWLRRPNLNIHCPDSIGESVPGIVVR